MMYLLPLLPRMIVSSRTAITPLSNIVKRDYMKGKGSRAEQNIRPQGMSSASLKHHYSLVPLFVVIGAAMGFVVFYVARLATRSTDVNWAKKKEPWDEWKDKEFKFINQTPGAGIPSPVTNIIPTRDQ